MSAATVTEELVDGLLPSPFTAAVAAWCRVACFLSWYCFPPGCCLAAPPCPLPAALAFGLLTGVCFLRVVLPGRALAVAVFPALEATSCCDACR